MSYIPARAESVLPNRGHWPRVAALAVAATIALPIVATSTTSATAAPRPITITVAGPTTTVRTPVAETTVMAWMQTRDGAARMSVRGGFASITVASSRIVIGESVIEVTRRDKPTVDRVCVVSRRTTRVSAPLLSATPEFVLVSGIASHYDPTLGGYMGDSLSPVLIQIRRGGTWATLRTVTTSPRGGFSVQIHLPPGRQDLRLVRPVGVTVTGGTGVAASVIVPARGNPICGC